MQIELTDALILLVRWIHAMAAVIWIGAACAILSIRSHLIAEGSPVISTIEQVYRDFTDVAIPIFLLTGVLLTVERFSWGVPGPVYVGLLSAKVVLAFGMFHIGHRSRRTGVTGTVNPLRGLCVSGAGIVLLATILKALSGGAPT
ncbi:MAG: hypothetical protein ACKVVP_12585 [Chloroflexota bacterium]